jgi:hypothetical protein
MKTWVTLLLFGFSANAFAGNWSPTNYAAATQTEIDAMIHSFGANSLGRPMTSATALGTMLGLDVGLQAYGTTLSQEARAALTKFGAPDSTSAPLLWGLQVRKGLPLDIDLGAGFLQTASDEYQYSFDVQWNFYSAWDGLNLAARASVGTARVDALRATSGALDAIGSYRFVVGGFLMEPYLGIGVQSGSGAVMGDLTNIPASVAFQGRTFTNARVFAGFPLKFFLATFTPEIYYGFSGSVTGGGKIAINF